ncbi:hypothetical protein ACQXZZ_10905 [Corynebacterium diphtheriae]|uniref:hypothetical protein n=1 Tax=Corynebacterium diphtheriae TaxID=1717 RepID=UPI0002F6352C|nr:hypothetical protein [Corynebacterium diphtheriae]MBG9249303.1 hypothetical protein [Corynebacterium diphtheriae bv. gravis]MBG9257629.1 hypothetical protein [Corynebacterium diphtheriae bv. mitis]MBG9271033.1 hypothetical protein [Corynebacterium diphtheriae bv. gravis]MBG9290885.1 hypothetical protein [Corynebacterium diphtheriae bv. gravis]MBG9292162.1 hypothetical protein [Corynebacterium diphtheriae bv. gravis]
MAAAEATVKGSVAKRSVVKSAVKDAESAPTNTKNESFFGMIWRLTRQLFSFLFGL